MAPEILAHRPYAGEKADVWSAGVVLFIMIAGNPPFGIANLTDWWFKAISLGAHGRFWKAHLRTAPNFPEGAQRFLDEIFIADPARRATLDELRGHEWMAGPARDLGDEVADAPAHPAAQIPRERLRVPAQAGGAQGGGAARARARAGRRAVRVSHVHGRLR